MPARPERAAHLARRGRLEIYGDILSSLAAECAARGGPQAIRWTRVQADSGTPNARFKEYLTEMRLYSLVDPEGALLPAGREYLERYRAMLRVLADAGPVGPARPSQGPAVETRAPADDKRIECNIVSG